jgi:hypothetical protein
MEIVSKVVAFAGPDTLAPIVPFNSAVVTATVMVPVSMVVVFAYSLGPVQRAISSSAPRPCLVARAVALVSATMEHAIASNGSVAKIAQLTPVPTIAVITVNAIAEGAVSIL